MKPPPYAVHPSVRLMVHWVTSLKEKTGRSKEKDRITHRIPIASVEEIDAEVERWLRKAYGMDA